MKAQSARSSIDLASQRSVVPLNVISLAGTDRTSKDERRLDRGDRVIQGGVLGGSPDSGLAGLVDPI